MRRLWLLVALTGSAAQGAEYLELVESTVYETTGTAAEITQRAQTCISQNVKNDSFQTQDSSTGILSSSLITKPRENLAGGAVISSVDIAAGTIVANNRVSWSGMFGAVSSTQSTLTFLAKDGRFKIQHTNIATASRDTGALENSGYIKQGKWRMAGWQKAQAALESVTEKVARCVQSPPQDW